VFKIYQETWSCLGAKESAQNVIMYHLYARPKVETNRDYQISIMAEPIELLIGSIDSAYPKLYNKSMLVFIVHAVGKMLS